MEELLKQIGQKALDCPTNTKESRARKGAYVDCIMMIKEALRKHDVRQSLPDIRNKLTPFKNLIALIENGQLKSTVEIGNILQDEIKQCKENIEYLSGNVA